MAESHPSDSETDPAEEIEVINASFDTADAWNVPVNVQLNEEHELGTDTKTGFFFLGADLYAPRKDKVDPEHFGVRARDPELLRQVVAEKVVPLYASALEGLQGVVNGTASSVQDWSAVEPQASR